MTELVELRKKVVELDGKEGYGAAHEEFYQRFTELDVRFNLETVMNQIIDKETNHKHENLYQKIISLLEELHNNQTAEEEMFTSPVPAQLKKTYSNSRLRNSSNFDVKSQSSPDFQQKLRNGLVNRLSRTRDQMI